MRLCFRQQSKLKYLVMSILWLLMNSDEVFCVAFISIQVECIRRDGMRGGKWSDATVQMAMKLRCACGNKGYMCINENVVPLPSVRTLQRKIEHVKFKPGKFSPYCSPASYYRLKIVQCFSIFVFLVLRKYLHPVLIVYAYT